MEDLHFLADAALADAKGPTPVRPVPAAPVGQRITLPPLASIMPSPPPTANGNQPRGSDFSLARYSQPQRPVTGWYPGINDGLYTWQIQRTEPSSLGSARSARHHLFLEGDSRYTPMTRPLSRGAIATHSRPQSRNAVQKPPRQQPQPFPSSSSNTAPEPHPLAGLRLDKTYPERSVLGWHEDAQRLLAPPTSSSYMLPTRQQSFSYPPAAQRHQQTPNHHSYAQDLPATPHHLPNTLSLRQKKSHPPPHQWAHIDPLSHNPPPLIAHPALPQYPGTSYNYDSRHLPIPPSPPSLFRRSPSIAPSLVFSDKIQTRLGISASDDSIALHRGRAADRHLSNESRRSVSEHVGPSLDHLALPIEARTVPSAGQGDAPANDIKVRAAKARKRHSSSSAVSPPPTLSKNDGNVVVTGRNGRSQASRSSERESSSSAPYGDSVSPSSSSSSSSATGKSDKAPARQRGTTIRLRIPPCPPSSIISGVSAPQSSIARTQSMPTSSPTSSLHVKNESNYDWPPGPSRPGSKRTERKRSRQQLGSGSKVSRSTSSKRQLRDRGRTSMSLDVDDEASSGSGDSDENDGDHVGFGDGDGGPHEASGMEGEGKSRSSGTGRKKNGARRREQNAVAQKRFRRKSGFGGRRSSWGCRWPQTSSRRRRSTMRSRGSWRRRTRRWRPCKGR